jgi:hypothetical protein
MFCLMLTVVWGFQFVSQKVTCTLNFVENRFQYNRGFLWNTIRLAEELGDWLHSVLSIKRVECNAILPLCSSRLCLTSIGCSSAVLGVCTCFHSVIYVTLKINCFVYMNQWQKYLLMFLALLYVIQRVILLWQNYLISPNVIYIVVFHSQNCYSTALGTPFGMSL